MRIFKINRKLSVVANTTSSRSGFNHVVTLMDNGREVSSVKVHYINRTWERYDYETALQRLLEKSDFLSDADKHAFRKMIENGGEAQMEEFNQRNKTIGTIAMMGEIFGNTPKEKNDWKARMIKAGLGNSGIDMPSDWDTLSEPEKKRRLDNVIKELRK